MAREVYGSRVSNSSTFFSDRGFLEALNIKDSHVGLLQMLEGITSMDRDEFLIGHELPQQHKELGFQELLNSSALDLQCHGADYDYINQVQVQVHPFEPESCITHVSEPCTSLVNYHQEAREQHSGPEEGLSSASFQEPICSPENCKQKNTASSSHGRAVENTNITSNNNNNNNNNFNGSRERKKRKRSKLSKNSVEAECQRMTHIAVERNRRKQMNEHLNVLKSLMPGSFIQRGDQASIIGGAIDFVKELEHLLQSLQAQKKSRRQSEEEGSQSSCTSSAISSFDGFFQSPQYKSYSSSKGLVDNKDIKFLDHSSNEFTAESKSAIADVEVTMIETHAALKILSQKRPGQLLQAITALENLDMSILHLNITTISHSVLYSFNVKLEEECRLTSAEEVASAVHQIFSMIHSSSSVDQVGNSPS